MNEFALIDQFKKYQNLSSRVVEGIGDDTAVLKLDRSRYQLFTTDMCVEGVHFLRSTLGAKVGWKALAVNVSDIAAMGGLPTFAVISLGIPARVSQKYIEAVYQGLNACAREYGVSLVGGDTVRSGQLTINVALLGEVEKRKLTRRSGAKPGDFIFVTGPLGHSLKSGKHLTFKPRLKEARLLVSDFQPSAMMDISDGLAGDLRHILKASRVSAELDGAAIPRAPGAGLNAALTDGEDFELLFTLSSGRAGKLIEYCSRNRKGLSVYPIGRIMRGSGQLTINGRPLHLKGFTHF